MAVPLILLGSLGLGLGLTVALADEADDVPDIKLPKIAGTLKTLDTGLAVGDAASTDKAKDRPWIKLSGPLPQAALDAYGSKSKSYDNMRGKDGWVRFALFSKNWQKKSKKIRIYARPPGALFKVSKNRTKNIATMFRAPSSMYPKYPKASRKKRNARWNAVDRYLSPKADWNTFTGLVEDSFAGLDEILEGAGVVAGAIGSGGASVGADVSGQVDAVSDAIKASLAPIGNVGRSVGKRLDAAGVIVGALMAEYVRELAEGNPWAVKNGKLDLGKNYKKNPRTYEDLFAKGGSYPLLYNPPGAA